MCVLGKKLGDTEIRAGLHEAKPTTATDDGKTNVNGKRINSAMVMVRRLLQYDGTATLETEPTQRASTFHRALPAAAPKAKAKAKGGETVKVVKVGMYQKNTTMHTSSGGSK